MQPKQKIAELNESLRDMGMAELALVTPKSLKAQDINARYMKPETMDNLASNVAKDGRLESLPLVTMTENGYEIISGHHRVLAADKAGLEEIMVMVTETKNRDELIAKQISHNAITGEDDDQILKKMYEEIEDLEVKYYSGLQDVLDNLDTVGINFRAGMIREFTVAFMDEDIEAYDILAEDIKKSTIGSSAAVRLAPFSQEKEFMKLIREIKRVDDIKQNGSALGVMVELAREAFDEKHKDDPKKVKGRKKA